MIERKRRFCGVFAIGSLALLLAACSMSPEGSGLASLQCGVNTVPVSEIQGAGRQSPLVGETVVVQGIVTLVLADGFIVQEPLADTNPLTSDALLVLSPDLQSPMATGDVLSLRGTVAEISSSENPGDNTMTALESITAWARCGARQQAPLSVEMLPLEPINLEALEGMRLRLDQTLYASDVYRLADGRVAVADQPALFTATEMMAPGPLAAQADRAMAQRQLNLDLPRVTLPTIRAGDAIVAPEGVLLQLERPYHLQLTQPIVVQSEPVAEPQPKGDALRVVSYNLLNYFNGNGTGGGFPAERGAETADGFAAQRLRHRSLFGQLMPDLLAVMELENDGFGQDSAPVDLIEDLTTAVPDSRWDMVVPEAGGPGSDSIRVGLAYRSDKLQKRGAARTLEGPNFSGWSRVPLAQAFESDSGLELVVVVNHLKSKGGCPDRGEIKLLPALSAQAWQEDGQACWNAARTAAVTDLLEWVEVLETETGLPVLMVGDFNAYRQEDPIRALKAGGLVELMEMHDEPPYWTFVYRGVRGSLDYAFATPGLMDKVDNAFIWHANAADAPDMPLTPDWRRASDHDPLVIDLTTP